jgi:hypothetical protein
LGSKTNTSTSNQISTPVNQAALQRDQMMAGK